MVKAIKDDYKKVISGMVDIIGEHLDTLPAEERKRRIKAVASYAVPSGRLPSKIRSQGNGISRSQQVYQAPK